MPALVPTEFYAEVTWVGHMTERLEPAIDGVQVSELSLSFDGIEGVPYGGRTRPSCARVVSQHPKGTEIANVRQLSIVSEEELAQTAAAMGLETLDPAWLGASVVVKGIPDFTHVPPSSRLQAENGTTLVVDMENRPCHQPGMTIARHHGDAGKLFKASAKDRRGVTAWVERPGVLQPGMVLRLHVPGQPAWSAA